MSLLDEFMTPCCFMESRRIKDGAGGFTTEWFEGEKFKAAIVRDTTMEARIAEKQSVTSVFTITTSRKVNLKHDDKIKRLKDGRYFRVTSDGDEKESPRSSTLDISQVMAEKWELTK